MALSGFGDATFRFMRGLGRNNDKAWFQAHRAAYEEDLLEPAMAFIEAIGPLLARFSPGVRAEPTPKDLVLGARMHLLDKPGLERYRKAVDAEGPGAQLAKIVMREERAGYNVGGEHYKRVPAGFAPDHPREALLRHAGIYVGTDMKVPPEAKTSRFPAFCAAHDKKMAPLMDWLTANVA